MESGSLLAFGSFFFTQRNFWPRPSAIACARGGGTFSGACAAALQPGRAMSDGEDYGFEYSDDDQEEEDVNIENQYYNSKGLLADSDLKGALDGFKEVVSMEEDKGEWGFKAHKQMVRTAQPTRPLPRAATSCAAAGQAAVQAEELQGDDGHVQGHAHVHQVSSRARPCPRPFPTALHPAAPLGGGGCLPGSRGYDPHERSWGSPMWHPRT